MKAAKQGNADAEYSVGMCYDGGHGVDEDEKKAFKWFMKAAKQGNADGEYSVGMCYGGARGVDEDYKKADTWFWKAAKQGNADARDELRFVTKKKARKVLRKGKSGALVMCKGIDDAAAEILSNYSGDVLHLASLSELSDVAAESLGKYEGTLDLSGLTELSDTAAGHLAKLPNLTITLDNLPASAAQILRDAGHE